MAALDILLDSLHVIHKLMRTAHEEHATWIVEILERHRESEAACAAYALELQGRERKGRLLENADA